MFCWLGRWLFHFHQVRYQFKGTQKNPTFTWGPIDLYHLHVIWSLLHSGIRDKFSRSRRTSKRYPFSDSQNDYKFDLGMGMVWEPWNSQILGVGGVLFHHVPISSPAATFLFQRQDTGKGEISSSIRSHRSGLKLRISSEGFRYLSWKSGNEGMDQGEINCWNWSDF